MWSMFVCSWMHWRYAYLQYFTVWYLKQRQINVKNMLLNCCVRGARLMEIRMNFEVGKLLGKFMQISQLHSEYSYSFRCKVFLCFDDSVQLLAQWYCLHQMTVNQKTSINHSTVLSPGKQGSIPSLVLRKKAAAKSIRSSLYIDGRLRENGVMSYFTALKTMPISESGHSKVWLWWKCNDMFAAKFMHAFSVIILKHNSRQMSRR